MTYPTMQRDLTELANRPFDIVVIGGGIFGACVAWLAARGDLRVAIVDRFDFCSASSANPFKLIHGGLRYLQHGDLDRLLESANARRTFFRIAPHLTHPLPMVVPTYGRSTRGKAAMRAAMAIYDLLTWNRNRGVPDTERHVPRGRIISRKQVIEQFPCLPTQYLTGAAVFHDGQLYNPTRLVIAVLRAAVACGATAANYVRAVSIRQDQSRVSSIEAYDEIGGNRFSIQTSAVINAAGPYAEALLNSALGKSLDPPTPWSRDAFFVVNRPLIRGEGALALPAMERDADAMLSRGARHLFLVPWRGRTLVGVWHKVHHGDPDDYRVTDDELALFVDEINHACPELSLTIDDVSLWNAGLIPFGSQEDRAGETRFAHRSRLVDHAAVHGVEGIITLIGARYTTAIRDATRAVAVACRKIGRPMPHLNFDDTPVYGGAMDSFEATFDRIMSDAPVTLAPEVASALAHNHGSEWHRVTALMQDESDLCHTVGKSTVTGAEIVLCCREEMPQTLGDVVFRRTDLATAEHPGRCALQRAGELVSDELGWSSDRMHMEIERVNSFLVAHRAFDRTGEHTPSGVRQ